MQLQTQVATLYGFLGFILPSWFKWLRLIGFLANPILTEYSNGKKSLVEAF